jgi:glycosyltransferase involved in cell wall biosynthesis
MMPVYNGEKYVADAIRSLLAQTWQDWELIVVDDGSTDATPSILDQFRDRRIRRVWQQNAGEAVARNTALDLARGERLAFLDADDVYLPSALEAHSRFLEIHPEWDAAFSDGYVVDGSGRVLSRLTEHRPGIHTGDILEPLVLTASVITVPVCTMLRRNTVDRHTIRFDPSLIIGPDWDFWIQVARVARFGYLDEVTCQYRVHQTNVTLTSGWERRREDLIRNRMKVLSSDWFQGLSLPTRRRFFWGLLIDLLTGDACRQLAILEGAPCRWLPPVDQAAVWRHVAVDRLEHEPTAEGARACLESALRIHPASSKTRAILAVLRVGRLPALAALRSWRLGHAGAGWFRSLGRVKPKPVPAALQPMRGTPGIAR